MKRSQFKVCIIVSPSIAYLNNLEPIMNALSVLKEDLTISLILPSYKTLRQLCYFNRLSEYKRIGLKNFYYLTANSYLRFFNINLVKPIFFIERVLNKIYKFLNYNPGLRNTYSSSNKIKEICQSYEFIFFDITEIRREKISNILGNLSKSKKISINHALTTQNIMFDIHKDQILSLKESINNTLFLAYSKFDVNFYRNVCLVPSKQVFDIGIPWHNSDWLSKFKNIKSYNQNIFVVSRPSAASYLDRNEKERTIRNIAKYAIKKDFDIVVKIHPKEVNDPLYKKIFKELSFQNWSFFDGNILTGISQSSVVVTFFSGVCVDAIALDRPVIEYRDSRGKVINNNINQYENTNLVIPAKNKQEFFNAMDKCMDERSSVLNRQRNNYEKLFLSSAPINYKSLFTYFL